MIFHIATLADWEAREATYSPDGWATEGFVHCSASHQLARVANFLFAGRDDLVVLHIDDSALLSRLVWEDTVGGNEDFPHIYGPINVDAVVGTEPFPPDQDGHFDWWNAPR